MKHIFKYISGVLFAGLVMSSCSPDDFDGADQNGLPKLSDYKADVSVNQSTNIATFNIVDKDGNDAKGVYPIWEINLSPAVKTTTNGYQSSKIIFAGNYTYSLQIGNKNGISDGILKDSFTVDTTRYNFSEAMSKLTGGSSKEWRVYSAVAGHLGCGESLTNPTGWWSASPNEKAKEGIYDDRITFTAGSKAYEGTYKYSAGKDGKTFCNSGVNTLGVTGASEDYSVDCIGVNGAQTETNYVFGYDATLNCVTAKLPAKTLFPYIFNDLQFTDGATFYLKDINDKTMTWLVKFPTICWQIILINGDDPIIEFDPDKVNWCTATSADNLGADFNKSGKMKFWFSDADWSQKDDPENSFADGVYSITTKYDTKNEWQGQCTIGEVPLSIVAGDFYDISCKINASQKLDRVSIKINKDPDVDGDPNTLFYNGAVSLKAGDNTIRFAKKAATNATTKESTSFESAKFILDIGGAPAGITLKLSDIIIQKHNPK
nr:hypothetical protein [Prevotella sp.]